MAKNVSIDGKRAREFQLAFQATVRTDQDLREETARQMAALNVSVFMEQMADVPHDVAAIFSGAIAVCDQIAWSDVLPQKGPARVIALKRLRAAGQVPFRYVSENHPAKALFEALLERPDGIALCAAVSRYLAWALQQPSYRPYLFTGRGERAVRLDESEPSDVPDVVPASPDLLIEEREGDAERFREDDEPVDELATTDVLNRGDEENDDDE